MTINLTHVLVFIILCMLAHIFYTRYMASKKKITGVPAVTDSVVMPAESVVVEPAVIENSSTPAMTSDGFMQLNRASIKNANKK